jgi:quercetin dioxygenase-like cupin family protein
MGKVLFNANFLLNKANVPLQPSLLVFNLPILIENMKLKSTGVKGELNSMVLLKTPDKQVVLTSFDEGSEIQSFHSGNSTTFQVIEGKLTFHSFRESVTLIKGQLMTLYENVNFTLTTKEETVFLMTITSGGMQFSKN